MTAKNTAASGGPEKLHQRMVRALLSGLIAACGRVSPTPEQGRPMRDERELDQRVRECGEW